MTASGLPAKLGSLKKYGRAETSNSRFWLTNFRAISRMPMSAQATAMTSRMIVPQPPSRMATARKTANSVPAFQNQLSVKPS